MNVFWREKPLTEVENKLLHMCLMAHALGLGACWLTHGEETQKALRKHFNLPEYIVSRCHIIVGWPDEAPIKSVRMRLDGAIINTR